MQSDRFGPSDAAGRPGARDGSQRLVRVDLNEQAYQLGARAARSRGSSGPGERLGLQALADELGVSRSPVHQALTRLVSEGLVTDSRRGYRVRPITAQLMRETHDARAALEMFAVEQRCGEVGPRDLAALRGRCEAARSRRSETPSSSTSSRTCAPTRRSTS